MNLNHKKVAVVGFGLEGKAAAKYASENGAQVTVLDLNEHAELNYNSRFGENYLDQLVDFDLVFRSPSVRPDLLKTAKQTTSNTNVFFEEFGGLTIGVTGSKGKGTTATIIYELLKKLGHSTYLAGNVGTPVLDILNELKDDDLVVLELSSFQLIDSKYSPDIAVCLMIEPDHLNWHPDMSEYIDAKSNITTHQRSNDVFVHHPTNQNVQKIVAKSPAKKISFQHPPAAYVEDQKLIFRSKPIISTDQIAMIGVHNLDNICAALTAIEALSDNIELDLDNNLSVITDFLSEFKGLEHRLEFVRELDGVKYYNDTFAVMPDAAIAGIKTFETPVIAIIGGVDKQVDLKKLAESLVNTKHVILIGDIADKLANLFNKLNHADFTIVRGGMKDIIAAASDKASPGDTVLLSPGTSSFDMFENYKHRGKLFKEAVNEL